MPEMSFFELFSRRRWFLSFLYGPRSRGASSSGGANFSLPVLIAVASASSFFARARSMRVLPNVAHSRSNSFSSSSVFF
jgi:hypothetical protein